MTVARIAAHTEALVPRRLSETGGLPDNPRTILLQGSTVQKKIVPGLRRPLALAGRGPGEPT
jgi:hypothetical protein